MINCPLKYTFYANKQYGNEPILHIMKTEEKTVAIHVSNCKI